jgi:hypothetical protein
MINNNPYLEIAPKNSPNSFMYRGEHVIITDMDAYFSLYGFPHNANDKIDALEDELKGANRELDEEVKNGKKMRSDLYEIYENAYKERLKCQAASNTLSCEEYRDKLSAILDDVLSEIYDLS